MAVDQAQHQHHLTITQMTKYKDLLHEANNRLHTIQIINTEQHETLPMLIKCY